MAVMNIWHFQQDSRDVLIHYTSDEVGLCCYTYHVADAGCQPAIRSIFVTNASRDKNLKLSGGCLQGKGCQSLDPGSHIWEEELSKIAFVWNSDRISTITTKYVFHEHDPAGKLVVVCKPSDHWRTTADLGTWRNTYRGIPSSWITHSCWRQYPFILGSQILHIYQYVMPINVNRKVLTGCDYFNVRSIMSMGLHEVEIWITYPVGKFLVSLCAGSRGKEWHSDQKKVRQEKHVDDNLRSPKWRIPVPNPIWRHVQEEQAKRNQGIDKSQWIRRHWRTTQTQSQNDLKTKNAWLTTEEEEECISWR